MEKALELDPRQAIKKKIQDAEELKESSNQKK